MVFTNRLIYQQGTVMVFVKYMRKKSRHTTANQGHVASALKFWAEGLFFGDNVSSNKTTTHEFKKSLEVTCVSL